MDFFLQTADEKFSYRVRAKLQDSPAVVWAIDAGQPPIVFVLAVELISGKSRAFFDSAGD